MSTFYYDFSAAANGTGTAASPYNLTGWQATTVSAGNTYLFKRGTTLNTAFTTVAGTNGAATVNYGAWYNSDGTDDVNQPKPVVITSTAFSSYSSTNKDYVTIDSWDIRAWQLPIASDSYVIFCGTGTQITNCDIYSNVGCIGNFGKSSVQINNNTLYGVAHGASASNCVVMVSDPVTMTSVVLRNNAIYHLGGGTSTSHAVRLESSSSGTALNGLIFDSNTVGPAPEDQRSDPFVGIINENRSFVHMVPGYGFVDDRSIANPTGNRPYCSNKSAIGLWIARCPSATITNNTISGMLEGIFFNGGGANTACTIRGNTCIYNRHFGIHLSTKAVGCTIESNICSYNGTSINDGSVLLAYGRGIECSSAAGQGSCANHSIRFNTCEYNYNYGGPNDNGSEGVGIGIDDGTTGCTVYGNTVRYNEGNGIQLYGGGNNATWTDTHNAVVANFLYNNCTASFTNRRSGGTNTNIFCAHISCSYTHAGSSYLANNVFAGTTLAGIYIDTNSTNITVANNMFVDVPHCVMLPTTGIPSGCSAIRNDFYSNLVLEQKYATNTLNGVGSPTFPDSAYTGTNDYTFNPGIDTNYKPSAGSQAVNAGFTVGTFYDYTNHLFDTPPTIGMYELFGATNTYYVSTTGSDAANGLTTATALLTISKGAQLAVPGDTIRVLPGSYQGPLYLANDGTYQNGTSAFPITLISNTLWGADIRALVTPTDPTGNLAAVEIRTSNWIIDGFEITGEDGYTNTADLTWNYSISTEWRVGVFLAGTNNIVQHCYIHDIGKGSMGAAYGGAGVYMAYEYGGTTNRAYYNTIFRMGSATTPVHGIYMGASACQAQANVIGSFTGGAAVAAGQAATNLVIANNSCFNGNAGLMWGQTGVGAAAPWLRSSVAFNNIFIDLSAGVLENGNIGLGNIISTNLFFNCTTNATGGTATFQNNVSNSAAWVNYVWTGGGDYHLSAGSVAINAGTASVNGVSALGYDLDGVTRSTIGIGAYEYTATVAAVTILTQLDRRTRKRLRH